MRSSTLVRLKKAVLVCLALTVCLWGPKSAAAARLKYPFKPGALKIAPDEKLLVVAPHPDDEALGAGGLLSLYGPQTHVLVLTDGAKGRKGVPADEERKVRARQFLDEMKLVRPAAHTLLGLPDGALWDHKTCLNGFDMSAYSKVFVAECDAHPDHAAAYAFVVEKLWGVSRRNERTPELYVYEVHKPLGNVSHTLDITDVMPKKRELIRCHADQLDQYCYEDIVVALNELRGLVRNEPGRCYEAYCRVTPNFGSFSRALFPDGLPNDADEARAFLKRVVVPIVTPGGKKTTMKLQLHPQLERPVQRAFAEMAEAGFRVDPRTTGAWRWSVAKKTGVVSKHAYGLAIDLNWEHNGAAYTPQWKYAPGKDPLSVTPQVVAIWKRHGFDWGGDFPADSFDPMHFCFTLR